MLRKWRENGVKMKALEDSRGEDLSDELLDTIDEVIAIQEKLTQKLKKGLKKLHDSGYTFTSPP